jgi:hypothetical protein
MAVVRAKPPGYYSLICAGPESQTPEPTGLSPIASHRGELPRFALTTLRADLDAFQFTLRCPFTEKDPPPRESGGHALTT